MVRNLTKKNLVAETALDSSLFLNKGSALNIGSISATRPVALGSILGTPENLFWTETKLC